MNDLSFSDIAVDTWVQNEPSASDLDGAVVLVEVFQINCPGCFLYSLPRAIQLHNDYHKQGLTIIGLATAFEDYQLNTPDNLNLLVKTGEVVGETLKALTQNNLLTNGKLSWKIPFAIGMDRVVAETENVTDERVLRYAEKFLPAFSSMSDDQKQAILGQVKIYLSNKTMKAETFELFSLQGTPSSILFDRKGKLVDVSFGQIENKSLIEQCL